MGIIVFTAFVAVLAYWYFGESEVEVEAPSVIKEPEIERTGIIGAKKDKVLAEGS